MNFHAMMKEYKSVDVQSKVEKENPHEFIKIVLNELLTNMKTLSIALKKDPRYLTLNQEPLANLWHLLWYFNLVLILKMVSQLLVTLTISIIIVELK